MVPMVVSALVGGYISPISATSTPRRPPLSSLAGENNALSGFDHLPSPISLLTAENCALLSLQPLSSQQGLAWPDAHLHSSVHPCWYGGPIFAPDPGLTTFSAAAADAWMLQSRLIKFPKGSTDAENTFITHDAWLGAEHPRQGTPMTLLPATNSSARMDASSWPKRRGARIELTG
ncbi:hypothetical protein EMPG_12831 [Blastomyces silverae]|uniref:Uncharacterized protein n=1 Tax=Blastomyces silverae TaxID=2060906 RepID=A0A0H1BL46_9EURO|nr:hypothetical protein EMPG_12831 [Blastomyces silverae]